MGLNKYIAKQFANPTGLGGTIISRIMNSQNRWMYHETIRLLSLVDSDSVLDIGCGNGYMMNMLARRYACDFTGIDISDSAIKDALRRNRAFVKSGRMTLLCQNASAMSFPDSIFSKVYTVNTVYFWENLTKTIAEARRVLRPGGIIINALYTNETLARFAHTRFGYKQYTTEELTQVGEDLGLSVDVIPILGGAAYCVKHTKAYDTR